jgi:hypothetical protein
LRWYFYIGILLVAFAELNFSLKIEPFAVFYIPIVWYGYILIVDGIVYRLRQGSLISSYPKEVLLMLLVSVPFWLIFELYNIYTASWTYVNYNWVIHIVDFTTIIPAVLETFTLVSALGIGKGLDVKMDLKGLKADRVLYPNATRLLAVFGLILALGPFLVPSLGFPLMWIGLFAFLDPLNYMLKKPSVIENFGRGRKSFMIQLFIAGIVMGFFWEFWNFQAYPQWVYTFPGAATLPKLFAMPLPGYLGYLPFAAEAYLFFMLFRSFIFKRKNELLQL